MNFNHVLYSVRLLSFRGDCPAGGRTFSSDILYLRTHSCHPHIVKMVLSAYCRYWSMPRKKNYVVHLENYYDVGKGPNEEKGSIRMKYIFSFLFWPQVYSMCILTWSAASSPPIIHHPSPLYLANEENGKWCEYGAHTKRPAHKTSCSQNIPLIKRPALKTSCSKNVCSQNVPLLKRSLTKRLALKTSHSSKRPTHKTSHH